MATSYKYLNQAIDSLLAGIALLTDDDGSRLIAITQKSLLPLPTQFPAVIAHQAGIQAATLNSAGAPYQEQVHTVALRYLIGKASEGYHSRLQERLWLDQVRLVNHINAHPHLRFSADTDVFPVIGELAPDGAQARGAGRLGIFRDDPQHIGLEFQITLTFHVEVRRVRFLG